MTRGFVGRADLLRIALTTSDDDLRRLAELAGYQFDVACVDLEDDPDVQRAPFVLEKSSRPDSKQALSHVPWRETPFLHASNFKQKAIEEVSQSSQKDSPPSTYSGWR